MREHALAAEKDDRAAGFRTRGCPAPSLALEREPSRSGHPRRRTTSGAARSGHRFTSGPAPADIVLSPMAQPIVGPAAAPVIAPAPAMSRRRAQASRPRPLPPPACRPSNPGRRPRRDRRRGPPSRLRKLSAEYRSIPLRSSCPANRPATHRSRGAARRSLCAQPPPARSAPAPPSASGRERSRSTRAARPANDEPDRPADRRDPRGGPDRRPPDESPPDTGLASGGPAQPLQVAVRVC